MHASRQVVGSLVRGAEHEHGYWKEFDRSAPVPAAAGVLMVTVGAELWFGCVRSDCGCCHASISFCPKVPDPAKQIARTPSTLRPLPPER